MTDLKEQLIRLGHQTPELKIHLRPILDCISYKDKSSSASPSTALNKYQKYLDMK